MKVLAIGNSFSEDATYYLHKIALSAGVDMKVVNLFIGGCSLETHAYNVKNNLAAYRYELNGVYTDRKAAISEVLVEEKWDAVTIQQVSGLSGIYESYEPYASEVLAAISKYAPTSKVYFHRTWAYDYASTHKGFVNYECSTEKMHDCILCASTRFARENNLSVIPSGDVIAKLRKTPMFDSQNGGISLCRDGFHMNLIYGRYATAATWFETLTGRSIFDTGFVPTKDDLVNEYTVDRFSCDEKLIELIKSCVHGIVSKGE